MTAAILGIIGTILAIVLAVLQKRRTWEQEKRDELDKKLDQDIKDLGTWESQR